VVGSICLRSVSGYPFDRAQDRQGISTQDIRVSGYQYPGYQWIRILSTAKHVLLRVIARRPRRSVSGHQDISSQDISESGDQVRPAAKHLPSLVIARRPEADEATPSASRDCFAVVRNECVRSSAGRPPATCGCEDSWGGVRLPFGTQDDPRPTIRSTQPQPSDEGFRRWGGSKKVGAGGVLPRPRSGGLLT
jgi:hypothetical protein